MVCLWGARDSAGTWYIYDEYYSTDQKATYLDHAAEIRDRHKWDSSSPFYRETYADPAAPGLMRLFTQKAGIVTTPAKNAVLEGINSVKEHLMLQHGEPKLVIDSKCENVIREMQTYRWLSSRNNDQFTADRGNKPLKKDDHTMDALRYMLYSSQMAVRNGMATDRIVPKNMKRFVGTGLTRGSDDEGWTDANYLLE
jgi:phage terminase large subunit